MITSCAMRECLDAVAADDAPEVPPPAPGWKRGVGYAGMFHVGGGARIYRSDGCGAIVKLDDFGRVSLDHRRHARSGRARRPCWP